MCCECLSPVRGCLRHTYARGGGGVCTLLHRVSRRRISFSLCATPLASVRYTLRRTRSLLLADLFDLRHAKHILHPRPAHLARAPTTAHCCTAGSLPWATQALAVAVAWGLCSGLLLLCNTVLCSPLPTSRVLECEHILCLCTHLNLSLTHLFTAPPSSYAHSLPLPRVLARKISSFARSLCACSLRARSLSADIVFQCLMLYDSA
jgi:hypothetical protein